MSDNQPDNTSDSGRLILHIGFHKTGSSAIQESLHAMSLKHRDQGLIYPEPSDGQPSHFDLAVAMGFDDHLDVQRPVYPDELIERYFRICRDIRPGQTVLLSSEEFCTANYAEAAFGRLKEFVDALPLKVTIVAILRSPADFLASLYNHELIYEGNLDFRSWLRKRPKPNGTPIYDFHSRLKIWRDNFDDVRVADFQVLTQGGQSIIKGFLSTAGLDHEVDQPNLRSNAGLHPYVADAVRGIRSTNIGQDEKARSVACLIEVGTVLPRVDPVEYYLGSGGRRLLDAAIAAQLEGSRVELEI